MQRISLLLLICVLFTFNLTFADDAKFQIIAVRTPENCIFYDVVYLKKKAELKKEVLKIMSALAKQYKVLNIDYTKERKRVREANKELEKNGDLTKETKEEIALRKPVRPTAKAVGSRILANPNKVRYNNRYGANGEIINREKEEYIDKSIVKKLKEFELKLQKLNIDAKKKYVKKHHSDDPEKGEMEFEQIKSQFARLFYNQPLVNE